MGSCSPVARVGCRTSSIESRRSAPSTPWGRGQGALPPPPRRHPPRQRGSACSPGSLGKARQACCCASSAAAPAVAACALAGAASMQEVYNRLADRVLLQLQQRSSSSGGGSSPLLIGVAGVPGSGKSSLVHAVAARLNARGAPAVVVPMDGFHYFRRQLDQMPDPKLAHARRGAEWTFDSRAYWECLASIKQRGQGEAPSFDHGVGDPRPADIRVEPHHRVVLSEGNYLLLPAEPWWRLAELLDDSWYIDVCIEEAMARVYARQTGNGVDPEVSRWRIAANDRPNAEQVETTRGRAALVVPGQLPMAAVQ